MSVEAEAKGVGVVTGGGSGIGEACARRFAKDGYGVAVIDQNGEGANRVAGELRDAGADAKAFVGDVADPSATNAIAEEIERDLGPVTALVTSAGILNNSNTIMAMDLEEHQRVWDVNYNGPFIQSVRLPRSWKRVAVARS